MRTPHSTESALKDEEYHYWGHKVSDQEHNANEKQEQQNSDTAEMTQNISILEKQPSLSAVFVPHPMSLGIGR